MKSLNYKMADEVFEDLATIQKHLTQTTGIPCSQKAALVALITQAANVVRNTGKLWSWEGNGKEWEA